MSSLLVKQLSSGCDSFRETCPIFNPPHLASSSWSVLFYERTCFPPLCVELPISTQSCTSRSSRTLLVLRSFMHRMQIRSSEAVTDDVAPPQPPQEPLTANADSFQPQETQVGGGPSPYRLRSNINLTPKAAKESHIAAGLRRVHSPSMDPGFPMKDFCDLDINVLKSMCVDAPIQLTPTSSCNQLPTVFAPPSVGDDIFSVPSQPDPARPSTSTLVPDEVLDYLGFEPRSIPGPALPASETPRIAEDEGDDKEASPDGGNDEDDFDSFTTSRGRYSTADHEVLENAFKQCLGILSSAATKIKRDTRTVVKQFTRLHGHAVGKSEWNLFQCYFAMNVELVRQLVGNQTGDAKACWKEFKQLPNYKDLLDTFSALQSSTYSGVTLQQRRRAFDHEVKRIEKFAMELADQHFDMAFVLVGNCVNEDASLGAVRATPGLAGVFEKRLHLNDNELLGLMKTHAYNSALESYTREYIAEWERERRNLNAEPITKPNPEADVDDDLSNPGGENDSVDDKASTLDDVRNRIKYFFLEGFKHANAPLVSKGAGVFRSVPTLPWSNMAKTLADRGIYIQGWPAGVEFPDETKKSGSKQSKKSQGMKDLPGASMRTLLAALRSHAVTFHQGDQEALIASKLPVIIGMAPPADSKLSAARRLFADGHHDFKGPPRVMTVKRKSQKQSHSPAADCEVVAVDSKSPTPVCKVRPTRSTRKVTFRDAANGNVADQADKGDIESDNDNDDITLLRSKRRRLVYRSATSSEVSEGEEEESEEDSPRRSHRKKTEVPSKSKGKEVVRRKEPAASIGKGKLKKRNDDTSPAEQSDKGAPSQSRKTDSEISTQAKAQEVVGRNAPAAATLVSKDASKKTDVKETGKGKGDRDPVTVMDGGYSMEKKMVPPTSQVSDAVQRFTYGLPLPVKPVGDLEGAPSSSTAPAPKNMDPIRGKSPVTQRQDVISPVIAVAPPAQQPSRQLSMPPPSRVEATTSKPPGHTPQPPVRSQSVDRAMPSSLQVYGQAPHAAQSRTLSPVVEVVGEAEKHVGLHAGPSGPVPCPGPMPSHPQHHELPLRTHGESQEPMAEAKPGEDGLRAPAGPGGRWYAPYGDFYGDRYPHGPYPPSGYYPYPPWPAPNFPEGDGRGGPPAPAWHEQSFPSQSSHPHYYGYPGPRPPPFPPVYGAPHPGPSRRPEASSYPDPNAYRNETGLGGPAESSGERA